MRRNRESIPDSVSDLDAVDARTGAVVRHPRPEHDGGGGSGHPEAPGSDSAPRTSVVVTVDGDLPRALPALRDAGLRIERTLTALSVVTGTVEIGREGAIAAIRGVHVEREQTVRATAGPAA
ncbi:hypothetical protein [Litorihabitans aurantiacus]|uniref:Uncharacterized protein n=1 Tax=Litorihabitans aurantiacus TaxID=1930061 RepID=A0AA37XFU7_9MICO|nr:hypothetical protein [Litorihabitans aurantiacus]GMA32728.1 hypothetical protein GCM10025875_27200 [Litorihabitans aurantiacus]